MSDKGFQIYLASRSPRRKELLNQIGIRFEVLDVDVDETTRQGEKIQGYVERVALEKARSGHCMVKNRQMPVLGADTSIAFGGEIIGKPESAAHAREILKTLSGRQHEVITAVAISSELHTVSAVQRSKVYFRCISDKEINSYIKTGEPLDKAGAYAVQGLGAVFIESIEGSYSGIMGLPIFETAELLKQFKITVI